MIECNKHAVSWPSVNRRWAHSVYGSSAVGDPWENSRKRTLEATA